MAIPVPHTWTAGDNATSSVMQTLTDTGLWNLGTATSTSARRPLALLFQTVSQSIASGATGAAITFDSETGGADYDNGHQVTSTPSPPGNTRYTANTAGWYNVAAKGNIASAASGQASLWLAVNGTELNGSRVRQLLNTTTNFAACTSRLVYLNVGDYLEVWVNQTSGGALSTNVGSGDQCCVSIEWRSN